MLPERDKSSLFQSFVALSHLEDIPTRSHLLIEFAYTVPTRRSMRMHKVNFTVERIVALKCAKGKQQSIFWDRKTPGLGLRVTAAGTKSYIFETRLHGRTLRTTIGD